MILSAKHFFRRLLRRPMHRPDLRLSYVVLGTDYGGWPLLPEYIDADSVIYSFGIGEDISFDLAAIDRYGCHVFGFDPTPKSQAWLSTQILPKNFIFYPVGIAAEDGEAEFFVPAVDEHVSFSVSPAQQAHGSRSIKAEVMRLETIISRLAIPSPDVLKMDIEGFEYDVIRDILNGSLRPKLILVEFHHGIYDGIGEDETNVAVDALRSAGYSLFFVSSSGREYGFVVI